MPHEAGEGVVGRPEEPRVGVGEVGGPGPQDRIREEWPWGYYPRPPPQKPPSRVQSHLLIWSAFEKERYRPPESLKFWTKNTLSQSIVVLMRN